MTKFYHVTDFLHWMCISDSGHLMPNDQVNIPKWKLKEFKACSGSQGVVYLFETYDDAEGFARFRDEVDKKMYTPKERQFTGGCKIIIEITLTPAMAQKVMVDQGMDPLDQRLWEMKNCAWMYPGKINTKHVTDLWSLLTGKKEGVIENNRDLIKTATSYQKAS